MNDLTTKERPVCTVEKVKVKNNQLYAEYKEKYFDANYSNQITKSSEQFIHGDLRYALDSLKPHVVYICEMEESKRVKDIKAPTEEELNEELKNIIITGYSKGGSDESAGVSISAQKLLRSGQVLNLSVPFTKFEGDDESYKYGGALQQAIERCDYEVDAYLFEDKFGIRQESFDFDEVPESDIEVGEPKKKRGRKKKEQMQAVAEDVTFDAFA